MAVPYKVRQFAVEKRHQKRSDVRAVHVGIGHNDDSTIAQPAQVEPASDTATQRLNKVAQLLVLTQLVGAGTGNVQDLAS